jgi:two-component system phosphate regulon sensor histidine kinase PhoR
MKKRINILFAFLVIVSILFTGFLMRSVIIIMIPEAMKAEFDSAMMKTIVLSMVVGLFVTLGFGFRLLDTVTKPINNMINATKNIANGQYGEIVIYERNDEIGELADNFNVMSLKVAYQIEEMNKQNSKTNAILSGLLNSVIAVDYKNRLVFANQAAEDMFDFSEDDYLGKDISEVLLNDELIEVVKDAINKKQKTTVEIDFFDNVQKFLNISANPIVDYSSNLFYKGSALTFLDVTEQKNLELMRKEFVANVSHELKTPLTSIQGFVETLKNTNIEDPAIRSRFLDIIEKETNKLAHLITDLLVLSDIEKGKTSDKQSIDINEMVEDAVVVLDKIAMVKDIRINTDLCMDRPIVLGKEIWFRQMLINLIENAIKYSGEGKLVEIKTSSDEEYAWIEVRDYGIGIPKEHHDRLFERFYRVEKSRNREIAGTGLGLSIVKHIVRSLGGRVTLNSELGKGTVFIVQLPIISG